MAEVVEPEATVEMPKVADCLSGEGHFQFLVRPCPATARWVEPVATEAVAAQAFEGSMAPMAARVVAVVMPPPAGMRRGVAYMPFK